jgi:tripartite-type tricarboxylate transporter receptor subunit TctC
MTGWPSRLAAVLLALSVLAVPTARPAGAQSYPTRAVKLVVPYAAGGPNDIMARLIAQKLSTSLGGQFYVENAAGAGGTIGTGTATKAPADGHTLLVPNQDLIVQPIIKSKVPYDPFKSFAPVASLVAAPEMIVVHPFGKRALLQDGQGQPLATCCRC